MIIEDFLTRRPQSKFPTHQIKKGKKRKEKKRKVHLYSMEKKVAFMMKSVCPIYNTLVRANNNTRLNV